MLARIFAPAAAWGPFFLRLGVGLVWIAHGLRQLLGIGGGPGATFLSNLVSRLGWRPEATWVTALAVVCLIGGCFLVLGFITRLAALVLTLLALLRLLVCFPGWSFADAMLLLLFASLCLLLTGGGRLVMRE